ncbi:hypothetical protein AAIA72_03995 [Hahella sp. SMD15-11]|uniref:Uncharacterized protein n=1 Tax=Thermohahella caldifontis TaxID=3142973 RepID=A0AB39UY27_9GAMM
MKTPATTEQLSELEILLIEELTLRRYCPECEVTHEEVRIHLEWLDSAPPKQDSIAA